MAIDYPAVVKLFEPIHVKQGPLDPNSPSYIPTIFFLVVYTLLTVAGIALTLAILYGGMIYITSAGDEAKAAKGRASIINGVIGAIIVLLSVAIIRAIQKIIG